MIPTQTLPRFIRHKEQAIQGATGELSDLLTAIGLGIKMISRLVATAGLKGLHGYTDRINVQGEQAHKLDDEADAILVEILGSSGHFGSLVSEERDGAIETSKESREAKYVVAFDPLDGSSNIGSNIPVGTIFTIFRKKDSSEKADTEDFLQSGRDIVAAGYSVYGSKLSFVYSCGNGVHGFTLDPSIGEFVLTEEDMKMPQQGGIYSVNEGYWDKFSPGLRDFINQIRSPKSALKKEYTSRYVGSLVADFDRNLRKGGIFLHPATSDRPRGKLRLLYECMPLAYIIENAGGQATDGEQNILDIVPQSIHERCPFIAGGAREIGFFKEVLSRNQ